MNLKKRLLISNVVMVAIPVAVELIVLAGAFGLFWKYLTHVRGIGAAETSDLMQAGSVLNYLGAIYGDHTLKIAAVTAGVLLVLILAASIALTNRFCSRFMLAHVSGPLEKLAEGTAEIGAGNLAYRLPENRTDEFAPIFAEFNLMAQRLTRTIERDRAINDQRTLLTAGLGHDLRTLLTSIQSYTEGLIDGIAATPQAREHYLKTILAKTNEMKTMTNRLLDAARIGTDEDCELEPVVLGAFVSQWAESNRPEYASAAVHITCTAAPKPARTLINTGLMTRALDNLASNCVKYAQHDGQCRMSISVFSDEEQQRAMVRVADNGPGVADEDLPHLFELFFRSDAARSNPGQGSGIGLAVVADAVRRMQGSVHAERASEGGLAVVMTFPEIPEGGEEGARQSSTSPSGAKNPCPGSARRGGKGKTNGIPEKSEDSMSENDKNKGGKDACNG